MEDFYMLTLVKKVFTYLRTEKVIYSDKHTITRDSDPDQTLHHGASYQGLHCLPLKKHV